MKVSAEEKRVTNSNNWAKRAGGEVNGELDAGFVEWEPGRC